METSTAAGTAGPVARGGVMFQFHTTRELLAVNAQYLREYREDPTPAKLRAVEESSRELSRRGA
jgi:hypothetical protein